MTKLLPGKDYVLVKSAPILKPEVKSTLIQMPKDEEALTAVVRGVVVAEKKPAPVEGRYHPGVYTEGAIVWYESFNAKKILFNGQEIFALAPEHIIAYEVD